MTEKKLRLAIAGVGNCAYSLVQAIYWASSHGADGRDGIAFSTIGGISPNDVELAAAFDVDEEKVGRGINDAFRASTIVAIQHVELPVLEVVVSPAPVADGIDGALGGVVSIHPACATVSEQSVKDILVGAAVDVLLILLPTGSQSAAEMFARAALQAGAAVVNATPATLARNDALIDKFAAAGLPLLGDDLRSHIGSTMLNTALIELIRSRGLSVSRTYQLNVGGNTDFLNLSDPNRSADKVASKANALYASGLERGSHPLAGPNGYVDWLGDTKVGHIAIQASSIIGAHVEISVRLEVEDSPNAAAVLITALRVAGVNRRRSLGGEVAEAGILFKSPPNPVTEHDGWDNLAAFVGASNEFFSAGSERDPGEPTDGARIAAAIDDYDHIMVAPSAI